MKICHTCQQTYSDDVEFCPRDGARLAAQATETEAQLAAGLSRRLRIIRRLGQGGMGAVFLAEQIGVGNRRVALKVLSRKLLDDPDFLLRFQNEAASTGRIHHPNVVTIYESGQADDGTPYIAMEFLEGESLREALARRGPLPVPEVAEILQQAARGLNAAHKLGIIHRDLKPDNIFLTYPDDAAAPLAGPHDAAAFAHDVGAPLVGALPVGIADAGRAQDPPLRPVVVKIVDFGIAKLRESGAHTQTGMVLGTPAYMSYEQASGMRSDELDARSDVYSLGVVVYEMLTGRTPFHSDTPLGYVRKHTMEEPPPFRNVVPSLGVPPGVESAVMKALVKDRDHRYASALDFSRAFGAAAGPVAAPEVSQPLPSTKIVLLPTAQDRAEAWFKEGNELRRQGRAAEAAACFRLAAEQGHAAAQHMLAWRYFHGEGVARDYTQMAFWLRKAAEQGYAKAQCDLGGLYDNGQGVPQDYTQAAFWWRKAAEQGNAASQFMLGDLYHHGQAVPQDYTQAALLYRKAAEQGFAPAQYNLGLSYDKGQGVPQDYAQAALWYRKAAEQGQAAAQCDLGAFYATGRGVPQDYTQAVFWRRKAAEQGDAIAQSAMGLAYEFGHGVSQDDTQAVFWFRKAAEQGHAAAQFSLGMMYAEGQGVPQHYTQAAFWYRKAAEQGYAKAQFNLGMMYAEGQGVPQDYTQAAFWCRKAAEQGLVLAQYNLGVLYRDGQGVPQDYAQAMLWYRKAAEQGDALAQYCLGFLYHKGQGAPQDYAEAYFWFAAAAAAAGKPNASYWKQEAKYRDEAASHLTPAELARVQERVRKWFEDHPAKPQ
jgi:hypothetical protein